MEQTQWITPKLYFGTLLVCLLFGVILYESIMQSKPITVLGYHFYHPKVTAVFGNNVTIVKTEINKNDVTTDENNKSKKDFKTANKDLPVDFIPINIEKKVFTFHHVCIEEDPDQRPIPKERKWPELYDMIPRNKSRRLIVVYNSEKNESKSLGVQTHYNTNIHNWPIVFRMGPPPNSSLIITDYPAYFSITTCTGNLYHYWGDSIIQLYALLKQTGRLHSTVPNMVYYRQPLSDFENILKVDGRDNCVSMHRFEDIIFSLSVRQDHMSYHDEKPNTCYANAVFGTVSKNLPSSLEVVNNVVNYSDITHDKCLGSTVLILDRNNRRILNMEEMRIVAEEVGFKNVSIVKFENRTFKEQLNLIRCTDILIGVHGAGLEWSLFLRTNASLLEIAWPKKGWNFFYSGLFKNYNGIKTFKLEATNVTLNWDSFEQQCHDNKPLPDEEREKARLHPRLGYSPWKWADAYVNLDLFRDKLKEIMNVTRKS